MNYTRYSEMVSDNISKYWNVKDHLQGSSLEEIRAYQQSVTNPHISICTLNVTGDLNIGTILRSAVIFGMKKAYVFGRKKYDRRSTVGAMNYIEVERVDGLKDDGITIDIQKFTDTFKNYVPIFIDYLDGISENLYDCNLNLDVNAQYILVFGNEGMGIPIELLDHYKKHIYHIPQRGVLRSLNVGVAAGIVMNHFSQTCM